MSTSKMDVSTAAPSRVGRMRWKIAGVLGIGSFVNYIDRVNLSVAAPDIMRDFDISAAQMGILSSAFLWTYALLQMPIGAVIDKIGVRWVNRLGVTLWALASFLAAAASGLGLVIIARLILGIGEAPSVPAAWKAIGQWFPKQERGTATAIFDGASKLSNVLGIPLMAFLVTAFSWHAAFIFTGVLSVLFLVIWWRLYESPEQARANGHLTTQEYALLKDGGAEDQGARTSGSLAGLGYLLRRRKTWGLALGFSSYTYAYYVLLTWLPAYLERQFDVNLLKGGLYTMIPWLVAVIAQFLIAGVLMDRWIARTGQATRVRRIVLISSMLASLAVVGAAYADSIVVAITFLSIGAAGLAVSVPAGSSIVSLIAPHGYTGTMGGIVNFVANTIGIAAPIVTGIVVDTTGSFAWAFIATGIVILAGIGSYTLLLGRIDRIDAPPAPATLTHP
ncbi:MFS transporter [Streptomyces sp. LHD-70]|uniref:MFS transporter n=1 Tax=Streptomyces sp. LHD-70 TaxID=3072140 RepID=UPI00280C931F|nr:MFS transporter [Streptomyces sp. LHD-70]MDQ8708091.1 MFS transporter [Streptomyces sp. LHD-70]